jgi:hypothetical protein
VPYTWSVRDVDMPTADLRARGLWVTPQRQPEAIGTTRVPDALIDRVTICLEAGIQPDLDLLQQWR